MWGSLEVVSNSNSTLRSSTTTIDARSIRDDEDASEEDSEGASLLDDDASTERIWVRVGDCTGLIPLRIWRIRDLSPASRGHAAMPTLPPSLTTSGPGRGRPPHFSDVSTAQIVPPGEDSSDTTTLIQFRLPDFGGSLHHRDQHEPGGPLPAAFGRFVPEQRCSGELGPLPGPGWRNALSVW